MSADALAGTPLAPIDLPTNTTGFGMVEVLYLLARHPGDATTTTRSVLGVPDDALDVQYAMAGRSTLVARGLVAVTAEQTEQSRGAAALLEVAMGATRRWTRIVIDWHDGADCVVLLEAPGLIAVVQPRALGTFYTSFADPGAGSALAATTAIDLALGQHPGARVAIEVISPHGPKTLFVRRSETPDSWDVVLDDGAPSSDRTTRLVDRAGRDAAVASVLPPLGDA